jgi:hypothetical protein
VHSSKTVNTANKINKDGTGKMCTARGVMWENNTTVTKITVYEYRPGFKNSG